MKQVIFGDESIRLVRRCLQVKTVNKRLCFVTICLSRQALIPVFESDVSCAFITARIPNKRLKIKACLLFSIKDFHRLGRYKEKQDRPRPILVKFLSTLDANAILSNRSNVSSPIIIKPDMDKEERDTESMLLSERWNLIQSGIDRKLMKIRNKQIYVNNQLYTLKNLVCTAHQNWCASIVQTGTPFLGVPGTLNLVCYTHHFRVCYAHHI